MLCLGAAEAHDRFPAHTVGRLLRQHGNSAIEVGDALIAVGDATHAVLVTGVKEDANGKVIWVEITEETPPLAKVTRYGEGELFSMSELNSAHFEKGCTGVYRNTDYRDGTTYKAFLCLSDRRRALRQLPQIQPVQHRHPRHRRRQHNRSMLVGRRKRRRVCVCR